MPLPTREKHNRKKKPTSQSQSQQKAQTIKPRRHQSAQTKVNTLKKHSTQGVNCANWLHHTEFTREEPKLKEQTIRLRWCAIGTEKKENTLSMPKLNILHSCYNTCITGRERWAESFFSTAFSVQCIQSLANYFINKVYLIICKVPTLHRHSS